jgi:hypothetical protein
MGRRLLFLARIAAFAVLVGILVRFAVRLRHGPTPARVGPSEPPSWPPIVVEPREETDAWVEPDGGGCPDTHPIKVKERSGIYHEPGMLNYDRTVPDRCYCDGAAAEADGFRDAKR